MTDRPTNVPDEGEILYEALSPAFTSGVTGLNEDNDPDWTALQLIGAIGAMFDQAWQLVYGDPTVPWGIIFDVDNCPGWGLGYLGQFIGVIRSDVWDDARTRAEIKDPQGFKRGRTEVMVLAAQRTLTGTKSVYVDEMWALGVDPNYSIRIRTLASETPDVTVVERDVRSKKPAGLILTYGTIVGNTYEDTTDTGNDYADSTTEWTTYRRRTTAIPTL